MVLILTNLFHLALMLALPSLGFLWSRLLVYTGIWKCCNVGGGKGAHEETLNSGLNNSQL